MNDRKERRLLSLKRRVALRDSNYDALWADLARGIRESGGHAWRFSAAGDPDLRLEFIEYEAGDDPRGNAVIAEILAELERTVAPAMLEEWLEDR